MQKARIVVVILVALVVGGLAAGSANAFTFRLDQGWIRSTLLGLVNAQFNGRVRIEGNISISIGTQLTVAVEDVVVDNPEWAQGDLARFGEVRAVLPIGPLLQGQLVFNELELTGARADLLRAADGRANWSFVAEAAKPVGEALEEVDAARPPAEPGPPPDPDSPEGQTVQILPQVPRIESLRVADVAVTYRSLANGAELTARLDELTGQAGGTLPLELRGSGAVEEQPMTITVDASGLQQLEGEGRFPLTARIEVGSTVLAVQGSVVSLEQLNSLRGEVRIDTGPGTTDLLRALAISDEEVAPLTARLSVRPENGRSLFELDADIGANAIGGRGSVADLSSPTTDLEARLDASGTNLGQLLRFGGIRPQGALPDFEFHGQVRSQGSAWQVGQLELRIGDNRFTGRAQVADAATLAGLELHMRVEAPTLGELLPPFGLPQPSVPALDIQADVEPMGDRTRAVFDGELAGDRFHAAATFTGTARNPENLELELRSQGSHLTDLLALAGIPTEAPLPDYALEANIAKQGPGWRLGNLDARIGENRFTGSGQVDDVASLAGLELHLGIDAPTIGDVLPAFGIAAPDIPSLEVTAEVDQADGRTRARFNGEFAGDEVHLTASFTGPPKAPEDLQFDAVARGRHLRDLLGIAGITTQGELPPYEVTAELTKDGPVWQAPSFTARIGGNELSGQGRVTDIRTLEGLVMHLEADAPDLGAVLVPLGLPVQGLPPTRFVADVERHAQRSFARLEGRLAGDPVALRASFDGTPLHPVDLEMQVEAGGEHLREILGIAGIEPARDLPPYQISGEVTREEAAYHVRSLAFEIGRNRLTANGLVGEAQDLTGTDLEITLSAPALTPLLADFGIQAPSLPRLDIKGRLVDTGGPTQLALTGLFGDDLITADARLEGGLRGLRPTRVELGAKGGDISQLLALFGMPERPARVFELDLVLEPRGGRAYALDARALVGDTQLAANGTLPDIADLNRLDLQVWFKSESPNDFVMLFGAPELALPPLDLVARVRREGGRILVRELDGLTGDSDIHGAVTLDLRRRPIRISADLNSRVLDLDDLGPLIGLPPETDETASPEQEKLAREYEASPRLIPDAEISPAVWTGARLDVKFKGDRVIARKIPIDALSFHLVTDGRSLRVEPLQARIANGDLALRAELSGTAQPVDASIEVTMRGMELRRFISQFSLATTALGKADARIKLDGRGNSVAEILASADGRMALLMTGGQIDAWLIEAAGLDVGEIMALLVAEGTAGLWTPVPMRCVLADFPIENGATRPNVLLADTEDTLVTGDGTIDFGQETMDLVFRAHPRDVSFGSLRVPIRIEGRFKSPDIRPAPLGIEQPALAWLVAPIAAVLPFFEMGGVDANPCPALEQRLRAEVEGAAEEVTEVPGER